MDKGWVYVLKCGDAYKIGHTRSSVQQRLTGARLGNPLEVTLFHTMESDDPGRAEKYLHLCFATQRIRNEWFALTESNIKWLLRIKTISTKFLDRFDLTQPKPPARMTAIEARCIECGDAFITEQKHASKRLYCSEDCSDRYIGRKHYEQRKARGDLPKPKTRAVPTSRTYKNCVICNRALPPGFGPCCSRECVFIYWRESNKGET